MQYTVKQARQLAGKRQAEVASAIGVCEQTYRRIERNPETATVAQAKLISWFLGFPFDNIFFTKDSSLIGESESPTDRNPHHTTDQPT